MKNAIPNYIRSVYLDCTGEKTGTRWTGTFQIKCALTHADRFAIERLYYDLKPRISDKELGEENKKLILNANVMAELYHRVVDGPEWWTSSRSGQLLIDEEPIYQLMILCSKESERWAEDLKKNSEDDTGNVIEPS